jgi:hypothetical protein
MLWVRWRPTNGSNVLKMEERQRMTDERSGRPSTWRSEPLIVQVKNIIRGNRRMTVREAAEEVGIYIGSCHTIFTEDLGMHRVSVKFVPRLLTDDQKLQRFSICENLLQTSLPVMKRVLRLWCSNHTTTLTLQESCFASPQEKPTGAPRVKATQLFFDVEYVFPRAG